MPGDELANVKKTATNFANSRCYTLSKSNRFKVNQTVLKEEIIMACTYGELSALERLMIFIRENKQITLEEVEGALHLSIVELNNHLSEKLGRLDTKIKLDEYLEMRGYFGKGCLGTDLEEVRQQ